MSVPANSLKLKMNLNMKKLTTGSVFASKFYLKNFSKRKDPLSEQAGKWSRAIYYEQESLKYCLCESQEFQQNKRERVSLAFPSSLNDQPGLYKYLISDELWTK